MKVISPDGTHVLARNADAIVEFLLSALKTARRVEIVSTGSANSLVVRVEFRDDHVALRDDAVDEHGALMRGDERWAPTTGKRIREVILKCVVVSPEPVVPPEPVVLPEPLKYTYARANDKNATTVKHLISEYEIQHRVFDATKYRFPICPDVISLLDFPDRASFDSIFFDKANPIYSKCSVFNKLRQYFTLPERPTIAMIVMESVPHSYKPLNDEALRMYPSLVSQVCAMNVILFHTCKFIALDAKLDNWLYDVAQPEPLQVRFIDFGLSLDITREPIRSKKIDKFFAMYPAELPAYLRLMGASAGATPSEVMQRAIISVTVPSEPLTEWVHKIQVICMIIDGIFNMLDSKVKKTCQMSHVFNRVYNDACVTMTRTLSTMSLDLNEQLKKDPGCHALLNQIAEYLVRNGYLNSAPRLAAEPEPQVESDETAALEDEDMVMPLQRHGGRINKSKRTRKLCRKQSRRRQRQRQRQRRSH